jgi:hypothetical protein
MTSIKIKDDPPPSLLERWIDEFAPPETKKPRKRRKIWSAEVDERGMPVFKPPSEEEISRFIAERIKSDILKDVT